MISGDKFNPNNCVNLVQIEITTNWCNFLGILCITVFNGLNFHWKNTTGKTALHVLPRVKLLWPYILWYLYPKGMWNRNTNWVYNNTPYVGAFTPVMWWCWWHHECPYCPDKCRLFRQLQTFSHSQDNCTLTTAM